EAVYVHGHLVAHDADCTSQIHQVQSSMSVFTGLHRVAVPRCCAVKNTWLPAAIALVGVTAHFFLARHATEDYGISGRATAAALSAFLNLFLLLVAFRAWFGTIGVGSLLLSSLHMIPGLAAMAGTSYYLQQFLQPHIGVVFGLVVSLPSAA